MIRFVVMARDPLLKGSPDGEFAVVSEPMMREAARVALMEYAERLRGEPATRGVGLFLARWEVHEPGRQWSVFRVSS